MRNPYAVFDSGFGLTVTNQDTGETLKRFETHNLSFGELQLVKETAAALAASLNLQINMKMEMHLTGEVFMKMGPQGGQVLDPAGEEASKFRLSTGRTLEF